MAVLDPNEIFFTAFEPKQQNRFILYMDFLILLNVLASSVAKPDSLF